MLNLIHDLNEAQRAAVTHLDGPLMIIAGAGSGKTRVITYRIAFLAREIGIPIGNMLAVTFTNKAAREMRDRVCRLLDVPDLPALPIGTFHSRCAMILRRECEAAGIDRNFVILDETDQRQAIKRVLKDMELSEKRARPAQVQAFINQAKMRLLTPADCKEDFDEDEIPYPDIYARYQQTIEKSKALDFEDLIMRTVRLFQQHEDVRRAWANRYKFVLIDEYQDTNHAQFLLTKLLAQDHRNICVVGDEDQSIYSWRGAEIGNLLDFEKSFPGAKLVKLERNYRSTEIILRAANAVIERNTQRIGKTLYTEEGEGIPLRLVNSRRQDDEAHAIGMECLRLIQSEGVDPNQIAIFYRSHWLSRSVEDGLRQLRLPYRIVGGIRFYDRAEVKDILCFLRLAVNPDDDLAFERVANRPIRGVGNKTLEQIALHAAEQGISLLRAAGQLAEQGAIKGKARNGLAVFIDAIYQWHAMAGHASASEILGAVLTSTNYREDGVGDLTSIEADSRLENIDELQAVIDDYTQTDEDGGMLAEFLTSMSLDATREDDDDNSPKISLLTIHNAKGLEFDHVFLTGLEQGVFPTSRALESMEEYAIEEERRLFYVAVTRARRQLFLCFSAQRNRPDLFYSEPSQFLAELPEGACDPDSEALLARLLPTRRYANRDGGGGFGRRPAGSGFLPRSSSSPFASGAQSKPPFKVGMRVRHRMMGDGVISEMGGRSGWERALIEFDDGRSQEFVLRYAPLTALEG